MSDQSRSKGIVLKPDESIESLKKRIVVSVFPELKEVKDDLSHCQRLVIRSSNLRAMVLGRLEAPSDVNYLLQGSTYPSGCELNEPPIFRP